MERLHIAFFGPANSGKSTLVNALCGQEVSLVSPLPGTTTDPVRKNIELPMGIGPAVLIDTAGIDDESALGSQRKRLTEAVIDATDIAVVLEGDERSEALENLLGILQKAEIPLVRYRKGDSVSALLEKIAALRPSEEKRFLTGNLVRPGDTVLLVMPQDGEAPKGRLILPQVQVIRELLDRGCIPHCCTPATLPAALRILSAPPALTITDSQAFAEVDRILPKNCPLTSFSILLAAEKGDVNVFLEGAGAIDRLQKGSRVLIAEACTHVPDTEDIGRVKIPALLRKRIQRAGQPGQDGKSQDGQGGGNGDLVVDVAAGNDFPEDLSPYDLIIHCGACVAGRRLVQSRIRKALLAGVPITNYGIALAHLQGILPRVVLP